MEPYQPFITMNTQFLLTTTSLWSLYLYTSNSWMQLEDSQENTASLFFPEGERFHFEVNFWFRPLSQDFLEMDKSSVREEWGPTTQQNKHCSRMQAVHTL